MADKKITELTEIDSITSTDIFPMVDDPSGVPETKKSTFQKLADWLASLTQTLTNKTLTSPVINTSFSGSAKSTGSNINEGIDDTKIVTPKAIADSTLPFLNTMHRQAIINGNFDIWQRGTSGSVPSTASLYFLADRWYDFCDPNGGSAPTLTRSRETLTSGDIPHAFYYSRLTTSGAGSGFGNYAQGTYTQKILNGVRYLCGDGKKVTVSIWARSSISGKKFGVYMNQHYGSGGSTLEVLTGTNWTLTSTWTKYTHTFTTNTLSGKTIGNDDYLQLTFQFMWGQNKAYRIGATGSETYGGSGTIDIAQVQLCAGGVALPFQPKSYNEELRDCRRYCYIPSYPNSQPGTPLVKGVATSTTNVRLVLTPPVPLRGIPALITGGTYTNMRVWDFVSTAPTISGASLVSNSVGYEGILVDVTSSGLTQYRTYHLIPAGTPNGEYIGLDAEF